MRRNNRRGSVVIAPPRNQSPGLVGTMARTAVIAGTATATVAGTQAVMGAMTGGGSKQAAAQQAAAQQAAAQQAAAQQAAAQQAAAQQATDQQLAQLQAQQAQLAAQQQALTQQAAAAPAATGLTPEQVSQLKEIASLRDSGILSEEEFQAQKTKILAVS